MAGKISRRYFKKLRNIEYACVAVCLCYFIYLASSLTRKVQTSYAGVEKDSPGTGALELAVDESEHSVPAPVQKQRKEKAPPAEKDNTLGIDPVVQREMRVEQPLPVVAPGAGQPMPLAFEQPLARRFQKYPYTWLVDVKYFKINGAVAVRSSETKAWDKFFLIGQFRPDYDVQNMTCCFLLPDSTIARKESLERGLTGYATDTYADRYFLCPLSEDQPRPVGVTVVDSKRCPAEQDQYVLPIFPHIIKGESLAVCVKVAYGDLSPHLIVEWMETQRYLKVDKVAGLVENGLNRAAKKVLRYYSDIGFFDYIPYQNSVLNPATRKYDYQNTGLDTIINFFGARYHGYKYLSVYGFNEFLIPSFGRDIKELIGYLFTTWPRAAGFKFRSVRHLTPSSPAQENTDDTIFQQYPKSLPPKQIGEKSPFIVQTDHIGIGRILENDFRVLPGFQRRLVNATDALFHQYTVCRDKDNKHTFTADDGPIPQCSLEAEAATDAAMVDFGKEIADSIAVAKKTLKQMLILD